MIRLRVKKFEMIETERLILRLWHDEDAEPYYLINQDLKVLEFLPRSLSMSEVRQFIADQNKTFLEHGYTLWAVEEKKTEAMIGFVGLDNVTSLLPFAPAVEIGWRLGSQYWGQGYATEAARAVIDYGFQKLGLDEIVSCTARGNVRSMRVMEKIGMKRDVGGDFAHSKLPKENPLSPHVLYRMKVETVL